MNIKLNLQNKLNLSPQMRQSIEILQMTGLELTEYLEKIAQENPVVELEDYSTHSDENEQIIKKLQWLDSIDEHSYRYVTVDRDDEAREIEVSENLCEYDISLKKYLYDQIAALHIDKNIANIVRYIIECLDEGGYLPDRLDEIAYALKTQTGLVDQALAIVRSLEPAGVGAYDLTDCLLLQLERNHQSNGDAWKIVKDYLPLLAKNQLSLIAKELKLTIDDVKNAWEVIKALNPKPGNGFMLMRQTNYVTADIIVVRYKDRFDILLNDYSIPKIKISSYYKTVLKDTDDKKTHAYLANKFKDAERAVKFIDQRKTTLLNCTKEIVNQQRDFFEKGCNCLKPLTLLQIADSVGLHQSTVSRAIKGKYLQCCWGTFALSDFFPRELNFKSGSNETSEKMKALISEIIAGEDKKKPLSDQQITNRLNKQGIEISRRTVAKYRDELGIQGMTGRKQF